MNILNLSVEISHTDTEYYRYVGLLIIQQVLALTLFNMSIYLDAALKWIKENPELLTDKRNLKPLERYFLDKIPLPVYGPSPLTNIMPWLIKWDEPDELHVIQQEIYRHYLKQSHEALMQMGMPSIVIFKPET